MLSPARVAWLAALLAAACWAASLHLLRVTPFPFAPIRTLILDLSQHFERTVSVERPLGSQAGFRDLAGVAAGMRRLTADVAWISVLQYYGAREEHSEGDAHADEPHDFAGGSYPALGPMTLRVTRLDPSFHYAYLYGAGALAFNLDRPDEALAILEEAIRYNPTYWKFRLYVGAIAYKQRGQNEQMIALLEDAIRFPDCPTMVKSILANIYEERGNPARSLQIWLDIFENPRGDSWYRDKAEAKIAELRARLKL